MLQPCKNPSTPVDMIYRTSSYTAGRAAGQHGAGAGYGEGQC